MTTMPPQHSAVVVQAACRPATDAAGQLSVVVATPGKAPADAVAVAFESVEVEEDEDEDGDAEGVPSGTHCW
jgi:hypothetical protein